MGKALVVDDSRLARVTLTRMLEKRGFEVTGVESGPQALAHLQSETPDVVFMDFMMPEMSGYDATRAIRDDPRTAAIPVVMCTSQDTAEDRAEAQRNGARGFITKPASEGQLDQVLAELGHAPEAPKPKAAAVAEPFTPASVRTPAAQARALGIPDLAQLRELVARVVDERLAAERQALEDALLARLEARLPEPAPAGMDAEAVQATVTGLLEERLEKERAATVEAVLKAPRLAALVEWNIAALPKAATVDEMVRAPALLETIGKQIEARLDRERLVTSELLLSSQRLVDLVDSRIPAIPEPVSKEEILEDARLYETINRRVSEEAARTRSALFVDLPHDPKFAEMVKAALPRSDSAEALHRLDLQAKRLRRLAMLTALLALATAAMALWGTFVY